MGERRRIGEDSLGYYEGETVKSATTIVAHPKGKPQIWKISDFESQNETKIPSAADHYLLSYP
jgi:hypothetical protein